jgi:monoamine oxidase
MNQQGPKSEFDADVVVVGAGFGGMVAAYRLSQQHHSVIVVDAMDRVGGRSWTTTLSDGTFLDIGAGWTGSAEQNILRLVAELKLETYQQYGLGENEGDNLLVGLNGEMKYYKGLDFPVSDEARAEVGAAIGIINTLAETVPFDAPWTAPSARAWDSVSAGVFVRDNVATPEATAVVMANLTTIFGLNPFAVSLLHLLWESHTMGGVQYFGAIPNGSTELRIEGGTQQIPLRIAQILGPPRLLLASPVREISQDDAGVTVVSERRTLRCRRVIVAIPTCLTSFIRFQPILPADRAQLIQRVPQGSAMKVQLVYDHAFWREKNFQGRPSGMNGYSFAINDSIVPQTLDAGGPKAKDTPGILSCFIDDDKARDLGRLSQEERKELILRELVPRFTGRVRELSTKIMPNYIEFLSQNLEWIRGDYASTPGPRVLTASGFGPALRNPVGRIHWAGVDTATIAYQSIEGAAQSGERVAAEVIQAGLRSESGDRPVAATVHGH